MDSPLFSAAYIILGINEKGLPDSIIPHYNNKGTYISAAITLALAWTKSPVGRQPYIALAAVFLPQSIDSWRKDLTDEQVADMFFTKLYAYFCYVLDTKQWENENYYSCHYRRISSPDGRNFNTRNQAIVINGVRSERMCRAGVRAVTSGDPNSKESKRFQTFLFALAKSIYHELGHMFITFLGGGVVNTPPHITVYKSGELQRDIGEAGRFVEDRLFGGLIITFKDKEDDNDQAGRLYLVTGQGTREITHQTIKKFVGFELNFPIPETELGDPPKPGMPTLGEGKDPPKDLGDPLNKAQVPILLSMYHANPPRWDEAFNKLLEENPNPHEMTAEMQAVLRRVPLHPQLRLTEKPKGQAVAVK